MGFGALARIPDVPRRWRKMIIIFWRKAQISVSGSGTPINVVSYSRGMYRQLLGTAPRGTAGSVRNAGWLFFFFFLNSRFEVEAANVFDNR